jgi:hypothetical protein
VALAHTSTWIELAVDRVSNEFRRRTRRELAVLGVKIGLHEKAPGSE